MIFLEMLAAKGLSLLRDAIVAKGKEFIEDKIGMKIPDNPTEKELITLKEKEMEHEEELIRLAIEKQKVDIEELKVENLNTSDARKMNSDIQKSEHSSKLAKEAPYYLDFLIVGSTLLMAGLLFFVGVPVENEKLAYMALGSLITMCGTILNFHRGSSASSKTKDDTIQLLHSKGT